jgi:hypothetical protein
MTNRFFVVAVLTLLSIFTPEIAVANRFSYDDTGPLLELAEKANALTKDLNDSHALVGGGGDHQQADCLYALHASIDPIEQYLEFVFVLVALSSNMNDPMDELVVNDTLAMNTSEAIKLVAEARKDAFSQAAHCSQSALVNTYAQKAAALADNATALLSTIKMKSARH